jgi:membrane protein YdbS with pleckstrin-like domain
MFVEKNLSTTWTVLTNCIVVVVVVVVVVFIITVLYEHCIIFMYIILTKTCKILHY